MSEKYPRLLVMRAQRVRQEDELAAPHRERAAIAMQHAREERAAREGLERIMRSKVADRVIGTIGHNMGRHLHKELMKAISGIAKATGVTHLEIPTVYLIDADPNGGHESRHRLLEAGDGAAHGVESI